MHIIRIVSGVNFLKCAVARLLAFTKFHDSFYWFPFFHHFGNLDIILGYIGQFNNFLFMSSFHQNLQNAKMTVI